MVPLEQVPTGPGTFASLGVPLQLAAVLTAQGLVDAFPIQVATLSDSLSGRDVLGQGRTGSGKTLAFALPIVARLAADGGSRRPNDKRPRALVLVPTRELAAQVNAVIEPLAASVGLRTATVFGGVGAGPQIAAFNAGVEILVACPGRLLDHTGSRAVDLSAIEITVLDEADHMADVGFLPMVKRILDATPSGGQRMLFSATLAGGVDKIVRTYLDNPVSHAVAVEAPVDMAHHVLVVDNDDRLSVVADLARTNRVVVFTRTKHRAKQMARKLDAAGISAVDLHGNLSQNARTRNLELFSTGEASVLVATDIAARGIHVDEVPLVVHADPPVEHKAYTHRSGRTARAGAAGVVVTIAAHEQVSEVRGLLRQAKVAAAWSKLPAGGMGAEAAMAIAVVEEPRFDDRPSGGGRPPQRPPRSAASPNSGRARTHSMQSNPGDGRPSAPSRGNGRSSGSGASRSAGGASPSRGETAPRGGASGNGRPGAPGQGRGRSNPNPSGSGRPAQRSARPR
ncbi:MAG: DEAD/DEAH box helicase [Acidimicrobiia bacterium]